MYQTYFGFNQAPFSLTPNTELFQGLVPHYEAIQTVLSAIEMGEGVIKVSGEVGTGKTMVCRMLINQLVDEVSLVYLPNPQLTGEELKIAIAKELEVEIRDSESLVDDIQAQLLKLHLTGKRVVALIDEAQGLSDEALETIRLFGNLETEHAKLMQIVLLGQPELDARLEHHHLRQLKQRISFSATLRPLSMEEAFAYIDHRVQVSGGNVNLFEAKVKKAIWKASKGVPRLINQVCHKSLLLACNSNATHIHMEHAYDAINDTLDTVKPRFKTPFMWGWGLL
ncbi:ExeA family protein [Vibrio nigripulchritudo]|uniref:ExeA family protein n=1 Tax=Vibrio nigripulchritudo TaxID=28173 RepID=UPI0003B1D60A|nr:AAA family ATPase [Vibrio nigripulchritudo]CCN71795.1 putative MSHA biogenesis protein MshM [Vibrio nigripulchritudo SFn118]